MYADDNGGNFSGATWNPSIPKDTVSIADRTSTDDDVSWLYPSYVKAFGSYVCPSTQNSIRSTTVTKPNGEVIISDLTDNAKSPKANGTSYEVFGVYKDNTVSPGPFIKKTQQSINNFQLTSGGAAGTGLPVGTRPGAAQIFVFTDGDDPAAIIDPNDINNWPDSMTDNHGADGQNFTFCDGHAEWVKRSRFDFVWSLSNDSNHKTVHP